MRQKQRRPSERSRFSWTSIWENDGRVAPGTAGGRSAVPGIMRRVAGSNAPRRALGCRQYDKREERHDRNGCLRRERASPDGVVFGDGGGREKDVLGVHRQIGRAS